jgi:hypothetical protein
MNNYCVLSNIASVLYCYYMCEVNILGTCIEAQLHFLRLGYDSAILSFHDSILLRNTRGRKLLINTVLYVILASRPCFMSFWPTALWTHIYKSSRRPRRWRKWMEVAPPGWPATTWCQTDLSKSVELPHGPINTPPPPA